MSASLLFLLAAVPLAGFVLCLSLPKLAEQAVYAAALGTMIAELVAFLGVGSMWLHGGIAAPVDFSRVLYANGDYTFALTLTFDAVSAVFSAATIIMTILIFIFGRYYMHREPGFRRFYATILLFVAGLMLVIVGGSFDVLFIGWELVGISSVLLIAFYRDRFLPARNALKVFSVYRIADAALLIAALYAHHVFGAQPGFSEFSHSAALHVGNAALLGGLVLAAAAIKSAQFPFSYWLPRAMEGPTTSSAIFYGALSVHMGVFLLLRTYPLWEGAPGIRIAVAAVGLMTALIATSIARVQSSIKTQIAYASISQIGLMFIELACGLEWLALLHFIGNAALRTYQLLISPSVVSYMVHDQFFSFVKPVQRMENGVLGRLRATLYVLGVKEWDMNSAMSYYVWKPLKSIGRALVLLDTTTVQLVTLTIVLAALLFTIHAGTPANPLLASAAAAAGLAWYIRAYTTKRSAATSWNVLMIGHTLTLLFFAAATSGGRQYLMVYGAGLGAAFVGGSLLLAYLAAHNEPTNLRNYHGLFYAFPHIGKWFFVVTLLFITFPISPSFIAQDALLSHVPFNQAGELVLFGASYALAGVAALRLYTKVFYGPYRASQHERALLSS